jgi:hypothetical protein
MRLPLLISSLEYFRYGSEEFAEIFQRTHESQGIGGNESAVDAYGRGHGQPLESAQLPQYDYLFARKTFADYAVLSHSPNLTGLPKSLGHLSQLSKLTCSHCPRLSPSKIPDLSDLPLLRDVKMNNLALVDSIPSHMVRWGTGRLPPNEHNATTRQGDGLEVLDLGNCSLPFSAVQDAFLSKKWSQLRSLSLHSNPLAISNPDYANTLQDSDTLPKLQIIDSKRVVERKRKGEVQESKIERRRREKKEKKRMTGANARETTGKVRVWGETEGQSSSATTGTETTTSDSTIDAVKTKDSKKDAPKESTKIEKRKAQTSAATEDSTANDSSSRPDGSETAMPAAKKRKRVKSSRNEDISAVIPASRDIGTGSESRQGPKPAKIPSTAAPMAVVSDTVTQKPRKKVDEGKVETVAKSAGGVDLTQVFGKPQMKDDEGGLGVGGW